MLRQLGLGVSLRTGGVLGLSHALWTSKAPTLDPDDHVHGVKCGLQILTSGFVLTLNLFDVPIELALNSADLLLEQIGALSQIAPYVTHLMIPQSSPHGAQTT
jgi:hypothetical protein